MFNVRCFRLVSLVGFFMVSFLFSTSVFAAIVSIESQTVEPGAANITVPVNIDLAQGDLVSGLNMSISFNATGLVFQSANAGTAAISVNKELVSNSPSSGVIKLVIYSMTPTDLIQNGVLANLVFNVSSVAAAGEVLDISITECVISDSEAENVVVTGLSDTANIGHITISNSGQGQGGGSGQGTEADSGSSSCFISTIE